MKVVAGAGAGALATGMVVHWAIALAGAILLPGAIAWWAWDASNDPVGKELQRRRAEYVRLQQELDALMHRWDQVAQQRQQQFEDTTATLKHVCEKAGQIASRYAARRDEMCRESLQHQLAEHLEKFLIRNHKLGAIDLGTLAMLSSYGIESAADVEHKRLFQVPGMTAEAITSLLDWRRRHEAAFAGDGHIRLTARQAAILRARFTREQHSYQQQLENGYSWLLRINAEAEPALRRIWRDILQLAESVAQARADAFLRGDAPTRQ